MNSDDLAFLPVDAELREAAQGVLRDGETLSAFIETSVCESIERRRAQTEFLARGLLSRDEAKRSGVYHPAAEVHRELRDRLDQAAKRIRA